MNKQEFLAMSLPYGVYLLDDAHISKLEGIVQGCYLIDYNEIGTEERDEVFPILHPLSDLTKEIEHKGEKFVPIDWLEDRYYTLDLHKQAKLLIEDTSEWIFQCDFLLALHLLEWHFDIADLISKGEAIDVNTLETNPYK